MRAAHAGVPGVKRSLVAQIWYVRSGTVTSRSRAAPLACAVRCRLCALRVSAGRRDSRRGRRRGTVHRPRRCAAAHPRPRPPRLVVPALDLCAAPRGTAHPGTAGRRRLRSSLRHQLAARPTGRHRDPLGKQGVVVRRLPPGPVGRHPAAAPLGTRPRSHAPPGRRARGISQGVTRRPPSAPFLGADSGTRARASRPGRSAAAARTSDRRPRQGRHSPRVDRRPARRRVDPRVGERSG